MSDVSFLGDKDKMANNAAYENKRALQKYRWMHQSHLIFAEVTRLFGRVNVVAYILIPILLRALLIPMRCQAVGDRGYMVLNDYPERSFAIRSCRLRSVHRRPSRWPCLRCR
ncbi:unnamed protein product [Effrenium voratum]|nr:unnamed protein product [Effrenium voratum]